MAARSVSPTGQWPAALRRRHSPPARPARPAARSRSACRAPADEHPPGCAGHQRLVIPEGFDQLCLGHRGAALDADFPGPLEEIRLGPVVVGAALAGLAPHPAARGGGRGIRDPGRLFLAFSVAAEFPVGLLVLDLCSGHDSSFAALHLPVLASANKSYITRGEARQLARADPAGTLAAAHGP